MKKLIFITLVMIAIFTSACKGDDITDDSLAGTTWRYDYEGGYAKLDFKPSSNINLLVIEDGEVEGIFSGKYSVSDNVMGANLYYYADGDDDEDETIILKGKIAGEKMTVELWEIGDDEPEDTVIFRKQ